MSDVATVAEPPLAREGRVGEKLELRQVGGWGMLPTVLLNFVLNILTLTLWRFWAKTRIRRYVWGTTLINGDPLEYTGTGWEMFRAFVVVIVLFVPFYAAIYAGQILLDPAVYLILVGSLEIPVILFLSWLVGMAIWLARRYRLSRTRWRGVRFGMKGSANGYAWAAIGYSLLTAITLGWYGPAMEMRLFRRLWRETFFGDRRFTITRDDEGLAGPLYPAFALAWFGGLVGWVAGVYVIAAAVTASGVTLDAETPDPESITLFLGVLYAGLFVYLVVAGLLSLPYYAALLRRQAEVVGLEGARFTLRATSLSLLWLILSNVLIVLFTLGIAAPFAQLRWARYIVNRLQSTGTIDFDSIRQNADKGPKSGEGLADFFDIGGAF